MIRVLLVIRNNQIIFFSVSTIILIMLFGCKKQKVDLQEMVEHSTHDLLISMTKKRPSDIGKRAKTALAKLENVNLDTKPILLLAIIDLADPNSQPRLSIVFFDESEDLRGLRIKERYIDSNGSITTLEEDYPVFVNTLKTTFAVSTHFHIHFRNKHQRKDKYLWLDYVNRNLDELIRLNIDERQRDSSDTSLQGVPFEKTPPIYISIPDPNRVQVEISAYDRAGNESDSIELLTGMFIKPEYLPQHTLRDQE